MIRRSVEPVAAVVSGWLLGLLACNSHMASPEREKPRTATPVTAQAAEQPQPTPAAVPRCAELSGAQAMLVTDYSQLKTDPPQLYAIDVRYDDAAQLWFPSPALRMPYHHASSIEWVGELPAASARTLRIQCIAEDVQRVESRRPGILIDATYRLRIVRLCEP